MISVTPKTLSDQNVKLDLNNLSPEQVALEIKNLDLYYGNKQALQQQQTMRQHQQLPSRRESQQGRSCKSF